LKGTRLWKLRGFEPLTSWVLGALQIQQVALGGLIQKLVAVFVAGIPLVLAGGVVYSVLSGEHIMEGFTAVYGCLYHIPGIRLVMQYPRYTAVSTIIQVDCR
jgi:hypothetical protein